MENWNLFYIVLSFIKDTLDIIISIPGLLIIILLLIVFNVNFRNELKKAVKFIINRLTALKVWELEVQFNADNTVINESVDSIENKKTLQEMLDELLSDKNKDDNFEKEELKKEINKISEKAEYFEFQYLNLFLVWQTKEALYWFLINNKSMWVSKSFFISNFPHYIIIKWYKIQNNELETIFSIFNTFWLIYNNNWYFYVSDKWKRLLKFLWYNIN